MWEDIAYKTGSQVSLPEHTSSLGSGGHESELSFCIGNNWAKPADYVRKVPRSANSLVPLNTAFSLPGLDSLCEFYWNIWIQALWPLMGPLSALLLLNTGIPIFSSTPVDDKCLTQFIF